MNSKYEFETEAARPIVYVRKVRVVTLRQQLPLQRVVECLRRQKRLDFLPPLGLGGRECLLLVALARFVPFGKLLGQSIPLLCGLGCLPAELRELSVLLRLLIDRRFRRGFLHSGRLGGCRPRGRCSFGHDVTSSPDWSSGRSLGVIAETVVTTTARRT